MWICEGNIASGKSSFLRELSSQTEHFDVICEPVEDFEKFQKHNPLFLAYEEPHANAAISQLHIINCIHRHLYNRLSGNSQRELISERSLYSPLVFNSAYQHLGIISSFATAFLGEEVRRRAALTEKALRIQYDGVIYLHTEVGVCHQRISKRNRLNEPVKITIAYLESLERSYRLHVDSWRRKLGADRVLILQTDGCTTKELVHAFSSWVGGLALAVDRSPEPI